MKKLASLLLSGALALGLLAGCGGTPGTADTPAANTDTPAAPTQTGSLEGTTLKVGASPAPHAEILAVVKELLAEEGINLEIVEFTDYIQPNTAVENGSIDANYFQHITYLNNFNAENGTHLVSVADVHYEPFGIYVGALGVSLFLIISGAALTLTYRRPINLKRFYWKRLPQHLPDVLDRLGPGNARPLPRRQWQTPQRRSSEVLHPHGAGY